MIQADTRELETKLRQTVMYIRQKEVSLFTDQFAVLASSATFMSSLGFGALNMEIGFLERVEGQYCSELVGCDGGMTRILTPMALFYVFAAAGTAFNLLTVILASFCMIFGPELAIRGTEQSMNHAVKGMYEERRYAVQFFYVGCLFIVLSGIALGWMKFPPITAWIMTGVFSALIVFCIIYGSYLQPKFEYTDSEGLDNLTSDGLGAGFGAFSAGPSSQTLAQTLSAATRSRPSVQQSARGLRGPHYGATHETPPPTAAEHSGNVFVDDMLRYAIFADDRLRLFSLDGKEISAFPASRRRVLDNAFVLITAAEKPKELLRAPAPWPCRPTLTIGASPDAKGRRRCVGTTDAQTKAWLVALSAPAPRNSA
ncbi:hypothetical protein M885DRAFT_505488 [Pelagophyceae sp. CCMP2097]|nr:hypothetical protein M885DRAFT_505488 [Pelagophyceae sp. CCMP2097]